MGAGLDRGDWPRPSVGAGPCRCRAPSGGAELIKREPFYTMDDVMCWSEDARDSAEIMCIAATDEKTAVGFCGPSSFDSTEDGMICIEDPESNSLKWICT